MLEKRARDAPALLRLRSESLVDGAMQGRIGYIA